MVFSEIIKMLNDKKLLKIIIGAIIGAASVMGIVYILQSVFTEIQLSALKDLFPDGNFNLGIVNLDNFNDNETLNMMSFLYDSYYLQIFVCIFAMLFVHNDIHNGNVVFLITRGKRYIQVYLSKLVVIVINVFLVNIIYLIVACTLTKTLSMSCIFNMSELVQLLILETIVLCIETIFFINVYLLFKNIILAIIALIMAVMGMPGLLEIAASLISNESINYLWIGNFATNIYDVSTSSLLFLVVYFATYGFVSCLLGYGSFRKFERYL